MTSKKENVIKNRYDITCFIQAENCNPNGDPDLGNSPRQDSETEKGIITDVAIKRRIRNYVQAAKNGEPGYDILVKPGESMNLKIAEIVAKAYGKKNDETLPKKDENKKVDEAATIACENYWDVRTFGAVLSSGLNAGQIQGAVQIGMASSLDPIAVEDITITRMAYTTKKDFTTVEDYQKEKADQPIDKRRTMGTKQYIPYGLYKVKITVSANLAEKVGFSEDDLSLFLEALMQSYSSEVSATKMGMDVLAPVVVFKHVGTQPEGNNTEQNEKCAKLGCAPAYKLFDLVDVHKKEGVDAPRSYKDYGASIDMSKVPNGVVVGFKTSAFSDVEWNPTDNDWIEVRGR